MVVGVLGVYKSEIKRKRRTGRPPMSKRSSSSSNNGKEEKTITKKKAKLSPPPFDVNSILAPLPSQETETETTWKHYLEEGEDDLLYKLAMIDVLPRILYNVYSTEECNPTFREGYDGRSYNDDSENLLDATYKRTGYLAGHTAEYPSSSQAGKKRAFKKYFACLSGPVSKNWLFNSSKAAILLYEEKKRKIQSLDGVPPLLTSCFGGYEVMKRLPVLDLSTFKDRQRGDYIDFLKPSDLCGGPIVTGLSYGRRFFAFKCMSIDRRLRRLKDFDPSLPIEQQKEKEKEIIPFRREDDDKEFVITIFQRYIPQPSDVEPPFWVMGAGTSVFTLWWKDMISNDSTTTFTDPKSPCFDKLEKFIKNGQYKCEIEKDGWSVPTYKLVV